jgi:hypothetical protein
MAFKPYVRGVSRSTTSESLRGHSARCGVVASAAVGTDRGGAPGRRPPTPVSPVAAA